jgi:hypothetical protein
MKMRTKLQSKTIKSGMEKSNFTEKGCWNSASFFLFYFIHNFIKNLIFFVQPLHRFAVPLSSQRGNFAPCEGSCRSLRRLRGCLSFMFFPIYSSISKNS